VGVRKTMALLAAEAAVTVVAPEASEALRSLADDGRVIYRAEPFAPAHLEEAFLVIAATDQTAVNQAVAEAARTRGVLLNLAADAEETEGDFATMATVRRGDLLMGITTGGAGPSLAARIKQDLESQYKPYWKPYTDLLRTMRNIAKRDIADPEERTVALRRLAASETIQNCFVSGIGDPYQEAMKCLFL
jgi:precorrin-2 dehydrogenase/sirohydrochlorin ferrochelatase